MNYNHFKTFTLRAYPKLKNKIPIIKYEYR